MANDAKKHVDIKVIEGGWNMDAGQQPDQAFDLYSIAQDVKHRIMESGLARKLVAERNPTLRADVLVQIEQSAEQDYRVIPGSAYATESTSGTIHLIAKAYEFSQNIEAEVTP